MTFIGITARVWEWVYRLMRRTAGPRLVEAYPADAQDRPAGVGPGNDGPEPMEIEPDESQDASVPEEPPADGPEPIETESPESQDTSMPEEPAADGPEPMEIEPDKSQDAPVPEEPAADGPEPIETESPESQDTPVPDEPPADRPEPMETESGESQDKPALSEPQADAPEPKEGEPAEPRDPPTLDESPADGPEPMETEPGESQDTLPHEPPTDVPGPEEGEPAEAQGPPVLDEPEPDGLESLETEPPEFQDTPTPSEPQTDALDPEDANPNDQQGTRAVDDLPPERRESGQAEPDESQNTPARDGETGRRERTPRNIGGRRSRPRDPSAGPSRGGVGAFTPKPELICRERRGSQDWEVILSVPEEREVGGVLHNGTPLLGEAGEYRPPSFSGVLVVVYADGSSEEVPLIGDTPFIIFKLRSEWQGDGRRTRAITRGHFIVIAPTEWTRTGHPPVEAAGCVDARYTAHFFFNQPGGGTGGVGGFEESALPTAEAGYALQGTRVHDDSESGDMFVGDAPTLEPASGIVWARVGEEAQRGWMGQSFRPAEETLPDVLGGRQGRFYVRVYDESTALVDSGEFRYSTNLREIRVNGEPYSADMLLAPAPEGHSPASLSFVGVHGAAVSAELMVANDHVTVAAGGVVTAAPHPKADETTWSLNPGGPDVVISLPRIWWRMVGPDVNACDWCDEAISMTRDEFRAEMEAEIEIRLPSRIRQVRAGFDLSNDPAQAYPAEEPLPLAAFVDYEEIDRPSTEDVYLRIRCAEVEIELLHVLPDPPIPEPEAPTESKPRQSLQRQYPYVNRPDGSLRRGRGFSHRELQAAEMTPADAALMSIPVDGRRRSVHSANIDTLNEVN